MPREEVFFKKQIGDRRIEIIKTYDRSFAREAFEDMDEAAQAHLWQWLVNESYAPEDIPAPGDPTRKDFLWEEALGAAREDARLHSLFVVAESVGRRSRNLYVSPDWPSAETYALAL